MKRLAVLAVLAAVLLSGCGADAKAPQPTIKAGDTPQGTPAPSHTVNPTQALKDKAGELLAEYYDADSITEVKVSGASLEVHIEVSEASEWTEAPDDWSDITSTAETACEALKEGWGSDDYQHMGIQLLDTDDNILLTVVDGHSMYTKYATWDYTENAPTISLDEYNAIKNGMSYDEVFEIVGSRGEVISEVDMGFGDEYITIMFAWEGEGAIGANANVMFQGGKVTSKAQFGLQ